MWYNPLVRYVPLSFLLGLYVAAKVYGDLPGMTEPLRTVTSVAAFVATGGLVLVIQRIVSPPRE